MIEWHADSHYANINLIRFIKPSSSDYVRVVIESESWEGMSHPILDVSSDDHVVHSWEKFIIQNRWKCNSNINYDVEIIQEYVSQEEYARLETLGEIVDEDSE